MLLLLQCTIMFGPSSPELASSFIWFVTFSQHRLYSRFDGIRFSLLYKTVRSKYDDDIRKCLEYILRWTKNWHFCVVFAFKEIQFLIGGANFSLEHLQRNVVEAVLFSKGQIGDWFVLYQLCKNCNPYFFRWLPTKCWLFDFWFSIFICLFYYCVQMQSSTSLEKNSLALGHCDPQVSKRIHGVLLSNGLSGSSLENLPLNSATVQREASPVHIQLVSQTCFLEEHKLCKRWN